jgi:hypothetical protein
MFLRLPCLPAVAGAEPNGSNAKYAPFQFIVARRELCSAIFFLKIGFLDHNR